MKILTFGCRLNTFETSLIHKIGDDLDDVLVVNTCAVTGEAERQCRQAIRKAHRDFPHMKIVVTGCGAQLHPEEYAAMPEVTRVLGNREKLSREILHASEKVVVSDMNKPVEWDLPIVTDFEGRTRAFLQIQQGCDHACTFCIIHQARGQNMGLLPDLIIKQAKTFVANGFSEIVLTGVDITSYPYGFNDIIKRLLNEVPEIKRLRLGSLDPACIDDEFISLFAMYPNLMSHIHLSIQAGDNLILKRMGRRHNREQVIKSCQKIRSIRPDMVFGADLITGFPTETEEQFMNTIDLVERTGITHLHVFPYSARPGTPAAKMPMIDMAVRKERAARLRSVGEKLLDNLLDATIGQTKPVLIEKEGQGYTNNYIKVTVSSDKIGQIINVRMIQRSKNELVGEA